MLQDDEITETGRANSMFFFLLPTDWQFEKKKKRTVLRNCPSTHAPFVCVPASLYVSVSVSVCLSQVTLNPPTSWTIKQRGVSLTHVLPTVAETQSEHKNHFTDCKGPPAHDHGTLQNHEQYTPLSWLLCPK